MNTTTHKSRTGAALMIIGVLLLLMALGYLAANLWEAHRAAQASDQALEQILISREAAQRTAAPEALPTDTVVPADQETVSVPTPVPTPEPPLYVQNPEMEMPEVVIDGQAYIGTLSIPKLGLELPVISQWSYPRLKLAPCRYTGSAYTDDMIILGHNYERHFRRFTDMEAGDEVIFTDMDGNVFRYVVTLKEQLGPSETARMLDGEWDLTLFTCAKGGKKRITLRCERVDSAADE